MKRFVVSITVAVVLGGMLLWTKPWTQWTTRTTLYADIVTAHSYEELISVSPVIVRGVVGEKLATRNGARDSADPTKEHATLIIPVTDYRLNNVQYLRGEGKVQLVLSLAGGTYKGVTTAPDLTVEAGQEYVFFLARSEVPGATHYGISVAPGFLEIGPDGATQPGMFKGNRANLGTTPLKDLPDLIKRTGMRPPVKGK